MKGKPLRVLVVEDNAGDARLLREMFSTEAPGNFHITHLLRMADAEAHLAKGDVDIVLLDMGLPDAHGIETVRRAHTIAPGIPLIVLTGLEDEALAAEAMKEGAQDYLIKGQIENRALPRALRHAIDRHRMQVETDLVRNLQMQHKDEFLSHVSHELRSPLSSIYAFGTIIADGLAGETNPQQDEYLAIILKNVKQLQAMIEDLLMVTQAETGKLVVEQVRTSVVEAVEYAIDTLRSAAKAKSIAVLFEDNARHTLALADPTRLRQILTILLDNAIKFTPTDGLVRVSVQPCEEDPAFLRIEVSDSGRGISAEAAGQIFERLHQVLGAGEAGRNGLGLGLFIARDLVMRHGGKIWVTSEPGIGSHFSFTIPVFSLEMLIAPFLARELQGGETACMLAVEISSVGNFGRIPDEVFEAARGVLETSLRSKKDLILPISEEGRETIRFVVLACAENEGAEAMGARILGKLCACEQISPIDYTVSIVPRVMESMARDAGETEENFAARVAGELRRIMPPNDPSQEPFAHSAELDLAYASTQRGDL